MTKPSKFFLYNTTLIFAPYFATFTSHFYQNRIFSEQSDDKLGQSNLT